MEKTVQKAVLNYYGVKPADIQPLGGGFYGRVFLITLPCAPFLSVLKLYLFPGLAEKEAAQLQVLSEHALLQVPRVYQVLKKDSAYLSYDVLFMEYIKGVNAGFLDAAALSDTARNTICENIVDNLIALHSVVNPQGFGTLSCENCCSKWQDYYYPIAVRTTQKAAALCQKGQISAAIVSIFEQSLKQFDHIFSLPITEARLIHGDYNTWNILLDEDKTRAAAMIDPFQCCWADNEYDLYQLDNANGKAFGLLKRYTEKMTLSENFEAKRRFYELYTEVAHYYDAQIAPKAGVVDALADRLREIL